MVLTSHTDFQFVLFLVLQPDPYSIFLHDCVMLYGLALNVTGGNASAVNGTTVRNTAIKQSFKGIPYF